MIDINELKRLFHYDESDKSKPLVRSVKRHYNANVGDRVGSKDGKGYLRVSIRGKSYAIHRLVFYYHNEFLPKYVDHINGDFTDNRIENLREATSSENNCNARLSKNNSSGVKGVSMSNGYWIAQIMKDGKRLCLYHGKSKDEAINARLSAECIHGKFSNQSSKK